MDSKSLVKTVLERHKKFPSYYYESFRITALSEGVENHIAAAYVSIPLNKNTFTYTLNLVLVHTNNPIF